MSRALPYAFCAWALAAAGLGAADELSEADAKLRAANQKVIEEIRAGNRDPQKLRQILAPAIRERAEATRQKDLREMEENWKAHLERMAAEAKKNGKNKAKASSGKDAAKDPRPARPTNPVNSLNGASRYGGGANDSPIVDPNAVPKEVSFGKGSQPKAGAPANPTQPAAPAAGTPAGTGGVDEIQF